MRLIPNTIFHLLSLLLVVDGHYPRDIRSGNFIGYYYKDVFSLVEVWKFIVFHVIDEMLLSYLLSELVMCFKHIFYYFYGMLR